MSIWLFLLSCYFLVWCCAQFGHAWIGKPLYVIFMARRPLVHLILATHVKCALILSLLRTLEIKIFITFMPSTAALSQMLWPQYLENILQMVINILFLNLKIRDFCFLLNMAKKISLKSSHVSHFILYLVAAVPSYWKTSLFQM